MLLLALRGVLAYSLAEECLQILTANTLSGQKWDKTFTFSRPGLEKYGPYQWLWDSSFHAIAWSRLNVSRAILELRTLLKMQQPNGKVPEMIFWGNSSWKDKLLNQLMNHEQKVTHISQMPMLPFVLFRLFQETADTDLLREFLPSLVAYHTWWMLYRQPDKDGLVVIVHPWESGLDASPLYDQALGVADPQPKFSDLYPQFLYLELSYSFNYNWDETRIVNNQADVLKQTIKRAFVFKDVGVNSVYAYGWKLLSKLARSLDDKLAEDCLVHYQHFRQGVLSLWDSSQRRFMSKFRSKGSDHLAKANTVQGLFPLLLDLTTEQRQSLLGMLNSVAL